MLNFLETFYESIVSLSRVYYHTSPLVVVYHILEIAQHLESYENDSILLEVVSK
jgi:hypothetical protein